MNDEQVPASASRRALEPWSAPLRKGRAMQRTPDQYFCADCDFRMKLVDGVEPTESFEGVTGRRIHRVVTLNGTEVHRCRSVFLAMSSTIESPIGADSEPAITSDVATD